MKKIKSIKVVVPFSPPDIDTDFSTFSRELAMEHCVGIYGRDKVSNVITFGVYGAKKAFKQACTIYSKPFSQANKISATLPSSATKILLKDLLDPKSEMYEMGADFRNATADSEWQKIIDCALAIEGRVNSTGVHAAGLIFSTKSLFDVIPTQTRQTDGITISQWSYAELESLGLLKMDFLGLDAVDNVQLTLEYIKQNGKTPPNMTEMLQGPMDDKKTYDLLGKGKSLGLFQLAGEGMQDLLKRLKPTTIGDIAAVNALYRPGPMSMNSHIKYADRKNGRESITPIHPEFKGTVVDEILNTTYSVLVYQEQCMIIAQRVCGWTLTEADKLRKVIGKKKPADMAVMRPKFIETGMSHSGFSEEAMSSLWEVLEGFGSYGFNLAHAIAYAMNGYATAYLKTNYPVEFMAALLAQNAGNTEKIIPLLQECKSMGITVGTADINSSSVRVAPNYNRKNSKFDIIYGFSSVKDVSVDSAKLIVQEREENGDFTSIKDFFDRCVGKGVSGSRIFLRLIQVGAFDAFESNRKALVENIDNFLVESKVKKTKGESLFDMFDEGEEVETNYDGIEEYSYSEKLRLEADAIGLYLTGHPLERLGIGKATGGISSLKQILDTNKTGKFTILGALTEIKVKKTARSKTTILTIDDGTAFATGFLGRTSAKGIEKFEARENFKKMFLDGRTEIPAEIQEICFDETFLPIEPLVQNSVYLMNITVRKSFGEQNYRLVVDSIAPLQLSDDGRLPIRIRIPIGDISSSNKKNVIKKMLLDVRNQASQHEDDSDTYPVFYTLIDDLGKVITSKESNRDYVAANNFLQKLTKDEDLANEDRVWPVAKSFYTSSDDEIAYSQDEEIERIASAIEILNYKNVGFEIPKNQNTATIIENIVGNENYDWGIFDKSLLKDA